MGKEKSYNTYLNRLVNNDFLTSREKEEAIYFLKEAISKAVKYDDLENKPVCIVAGGRDMSKTFILKSELAKLPNKLINVVGTKKQKDTVKEIIEMIEPYIYEKDGFNENVVEIIKLIKERYGADDE